MSEWDVLWRLVLTLVLSASIGLERELRQKSAGLRTHTLVGLGAALFTLVGAYGFADVVVGSRLDPTRVAAQVVTGIGFIGGGLIFVRRDAVHGLTTAAGVWVTAAVGMAAAADLPVLAVATAVAYQLVAFGFPAVLRRIPRFGPDLVDVQVTYVDGRGVLRDVLEGCTRAGFAVADVSTRRPAPGDRDEPGTVTVRLELSGRGDLGSLVAGLEAMDGVLAVAAQRPEEAA